MRAIVVGAGVSGLTAARVLAMAGAEVVVVEAAERTGGKLYASSFLDRPVDEGAESFLVRRPEAAELAAELGLALVHPVTTQASLVRGHRLHPLPAGTALGVPDRLSGLVGALGLVGAVRAAADLVLPPSRLPADPTVGQLVRARMGAAVVDRLVDPLLGGVYAGSADGLSVAAVAPMLAGPARSVLLAARHRRFEPRGGPVFGSVPGGLGAFAAALTAEVRSRGVQVRTGRPAGRLQRRRGGGWSLDGEQADGVVLAVPAPELARLLAGHLATGALLDTPYADVAVVTLAYPASCAAELPAGSGFLVPPSERLVTKAATLVSRKWGWDGPVVVRASTGRYGQPGPSGDDVELAGVVAAELAALTGVPGRPLASRVSRWPAALPQYRPGHLERVAQVRAALPAGLALAGAAVDGVGVPACIRSGAAAARAVLAAVGGAQP